MLLDEGSPGAGSGPYSSMLGSAETGDKLTHLHQFEAVPNLPFEE
jgi:hypothetical protein